jgi:lipopolysaccharide biosynthesis glycosyltransferase
VVIFDDYGWDTQPKDSHHHPKRGVDAFLVLHEGEYRRLTEEGEYQMILQKTSEMRIGFLVGDTANDHDLEPTFGYGANVAYSVDESYIIPLVASIHSLLSVSKGRITVYVLDCGLSEEGRRAIVNAVPSGKEDATLTFLDLPATSLAKQKGATWARIDLISTIPVERVLYLDADTLVLKDIQDLWKVDLEGKALGAAVDVGHPQGYEAVGEGSYFNAGVLLMDLAKIRSRLPRLTHLASGGVPRGKFEDQDVLNIHFQGEWRELPLTWNAQGLGTYADGPGGGRELIAVQLEEMKTKPALVHFTGPTNPDIEIVLNPWIQPYTAKPWGYAGAPGHPFSAAWWARLEKVPGWETYFKSHAFGEYKKTETEKAIENVKEKFMSALRLV